MAGEARGREGKAEGEQDMTCVRGQAVRGATGTPVQNQEWRWSGHPQGSHQ